MIKIIKNVIINTIESYKMEMALRSILKKFFIKPKTYKVKITYDQFLILYNCAANGINNSRELFSKLQKNNFQVINYDN